MVGKTAEKEIKTMLKDITRAIEEQNLAENYIVDDATIIKSVYGSVLAQAVKDLYNTSYDLMIAKRNGSARQVLYLKKSLDEIIEYFDSPIYKAVADSDKSVWFKWVAEMLKKPRINIGAMLDKAMCVEK